MFSRVSKSGVLGLASQGIMENSHSNIEHSS